jgi:hypothetical protein
MIPANGKFVHLGRKEEGFREKWRAVVNNAVKFIFHEKRGMS